MGRANPGGRGSAEDPWSLPGGRSQAQGPHGRASLSSPAPWKGAAAALETSTQRGSPRSSLPPHPVPPPALAETLTAPVAADVSQDTCRLQGWRPARWPPPLWPHVQRQEGPRAPAVRLACGPAPSILTQPHSSAVAPATTSSPVLRRGPARLTSAWAGPSLEGVPDVTLCRAHSCGVRVCPSGAWRLLVPFPGLTVTCSRPCSK